MMTLEVSQNEEARLEALRHYEILDTPHEASFDEIVMLAAQIGQAPVSLLSFIDDERQWIKAAYGFGQAVLPRQQSPCAQTILQDTPLVINDIRADEFFRHTPLDAALRDIRFYAGVPLITADGLTLGTLCIMDRFPRTLAPRVRQALVMLSRQVLHQLELRRQLHSSAGFTPPPPREPPPAAPPPETGKIAELTRQLEQEREQMLAQAQTKLNYLAAASHDIREPLNAVIGLTRFLERTELSGEQRNYLNLMSENADSLVSLVNDILDFAKLEAGRLTLEKVDFDLSALAESVVNAFAGPARVKGLELTLSMAPDTPRFLRGDPGRLRQILNSLIGNALKFTTQGEVATQVEKLVEESGRVVLRFTVRDTGLGLDADFLPRLFHAPHRETPSGKSLGLAIVKQLIEVMGGSIEAESAPQRGTTFFVSLPFEQRLADAPRVALPAPRGLDGLRALILEGRPAETTSLRAQASAWGMMAETVATAEEALSMLRRAKDGGLPFAAAILDGETAGVDGLELARRVKETGEFPELAVILLTANGWRGQAKAARDAGLAAYLTKPVRQARLFECLVTALSLSGKKGKPLLTRHNLRDYTPLAPLGRVLVAEDSVVNQQVVWHQLNKLGYSVDLAANGREALAAARQHEYEIILLDCQMPEMDGYETAAALRREAFAVRPFIVALTGNTGRAERKRCLAAGMDEFLSKPLNTEDLGRVLQKYRHPPAETAADATAEPQTDEQVEVVAETLEDATAAPLVEKDGGPPAIVETAEVEAEAVVPIEEAETFVCAPAPPEEAPIDLSVLARLISRDGVLKPSLAVELIDIFLRDAENHRVALAAAWPAQDAAVLNRVSHTLKSSSASMGAKRLTDACSQFNKLLNANQWDEAAPQVALLQSELERVFAALRAEREKLAG
jgi:signal transduction histidine kinase/DNA-binding response OmpR family regulator/HPt (histidine-containing phosphotransfer) domain-containing protein